MKLQEIQHVASLINEESPITVIQGGLEFFINSEWSVVVEAPDGNPYELRKEKWTAKDLVEFMLLFPLEDDRCIMMFIYNIPDDSNTLCLVADQVMIYFDAGEYEIEFTTL